MRRRKIAFPITVRQAQSLVAKGGYYLDPLYEVMAGEEFSWDWDAERLAAALARLAAKLGPDFVLEEGIRPLGESRPKGTAEVRPQGDDPSEDSPFHGGDGNSGEVDHPAATASPEAGQAAAAAGEQGPQGDGSPAPDNPRPETDGTAATSGELACGGEPQNPDRGPVQPPSTALGGGDVPTETTALFGLEQPRDAAQSESQAPPAGREGEAEGSAEPNNLGVKPPRKWGKSFGTGPSRRASNQFGGVYADLAKVGVDPLLLRLARQRLAALVGDTAQESGPRRDWPEFCTRLLTHRHPGRALREEVGRPILWILADVSGSCSSFAWPALQVAKACSKLGVPGTDVLALAHSNGYPGAWEINGRLQPEPDVRRQTEILPWFRQLARRYPPQVVVALGDWDAVEVYRELAMAVDRLLWLDNYGCSRGPRDQTAWALQKLGPVFRGRLRYIDGCRDAVAFINQIQGE